MLMWLVFIWMFKKKYDEMRVQLDELQRVCEKNQADYKELKSKTPELRVENRNEELYYRMRDMFNSKISKEYLDSVIYYFINKTAYSGMIRYNSLGEYNVPFGRYANFNTNIGYHIIIKSKNTNHTWDIYCRDGDGYRSLVISHKHKEDIHFMNRLRCIQRL